MLSQTQKDEILRRAKDWFRDLAAAHKENLLKLENVDEFNVNPFLLPYLGYFLEGDNSPKSLAKALILPRILGTSITTSFGQRAQNFITQVFEGISGSTTPGIDLEFVDALDGRKKYCQVKAGPNVINKDDVDTIKNHFRSAVNLARANHLPVQHDDFLFCLLYGKPGQENGFVKKVAEDYRVVIGKDFWHRFTGDAGFYDDLIGSVGEVVSEFDMRTHLAEVIEKLATQL